MALCQSTLNLLIGQIITPPLMNLTDQQKPRLCYGCCYNIVKLISVVYWLFSSTIFHLPFSQKASMVWRLALLIHISIAQIHTLKLNTIFDCLVNFPI
jgi:hypothetical protein